MPHRRRPFPAAGATGAEDAYGAGRIDRGVPGTGAVAGTTTAAEVFARARQPAEHAPGLTPPGTHAAPPERVAPVP